MLGNYRVAAQLVASRAVLSSTELVISPRVFFPDGFSTLKREAIYSSESEVFRKSTRRHVSRDNFLHDCQCQYSRNYIRVTYPLLSICILDFMASGQLKFDLWWNTIVPLSRTRSQAPEPAKLAGIGLTLSKPAGASTITRSSNAEVKGTWSLRRTSVLPHILTKRYFIQR
jgi:hypothetical protein